MTRPQRPRAVIDHAALARNALRVCAAGGTDVADLRADGYGHGAAECARTLLAVGLRLLVPAGLRDALAAAGVPGRRLLVDPAVRPIDPASLWGLPGADATPVMTLHASLMSTKPLRRGEGVSYGYTFRAPHDTVVGLVGAGYAQGVVREVGNIAEVRVDAGRARIVGRVAMDACVVDVGTSPAAPGADVVFFGDPAVGAPSLAVWTAATGLRGAEIVGLVGGRTRREHVR